MSGKALSGTVLLMLLSMGVLGSVLVVAPSTASSASEPPEVEWERYYGGAADDRANCVQQTRDGGYILAGYTDGDCWLVKTSATGAIQWSRTYGTTGYFDSVYCVQQTSDGGYILAGSGFVINEVGGASMGGWLLKTSSTGVTEWSQIYGAGWGIYARSVLQTSDGGYVFAGMAFPNGSMANPYSDFWLVKTSSTGVMEWNQTYGGAYYDGAYSVQQTSDGGYIIAGYSDSTAARDNDFLLVKTGSGGGMEWSRTYGGGKHEFANSVLQTSDGGYVIAGCYVGSWLVKTSATGTVQWNQTYYTGVATCLGKTGDGGYIIGGFAGYPLDFWLMKLGYDADGDGIPNDWERNASTTTATAS